MGDQEFEGWTAGLNDNIIQPLNKGYVRTMGAHTQECMY